MDEIIPILTTSIDRAPAGTGETQELAININGLELNRFYRGNNDRFKDDVLRVCYYKGCKSQVIRMNDNLKTVSRIKIWKLDLTAAQLKDHQREMMVTHGLFKIPREIM